MKLHEDLFKRHKHLGTFIETGTCYGRSVEASIEVGFKDIRSVEAHTDRYEHCRQKFEGRNFVKLWCGESVACLPTMISDLKTPALFWLDAHPSGAESYEREGQSDILKQELGIIHSHSVKNHVILIDDLTADIQLFCMDLFKDRDLTIFTITEGPLKVLEIV